jgi:hypothetical protein
MRMKGKKPLRRRLRKKMVWIQNLNGNNPFKFLPT